MSEIKTSKEKNCAGRREFLVSTIAGGLMLSLANANEVSAASVPTETVISLDETSPLNKVGGSMTVDTANGKVIVARTGESTYAAVTAACTHKGVPVKYDEKAQQFVCPSHGSKFGLDGSNIKGPAKTPLKSLKSKSALVILGE